MVVRTLTTLDRLRDVLSLTVGDRRIQTFFTHDRQRRSPLAAGVEEELAASGASWVPWRKATRSRFDLALAASENDHLVDLDAPVLLIPHGAGQQKFYPNTTVVSGLNPPQLVADDRVIPAAIGLTHSTHVDRLAAVSPAAATRAVVVGDPSLERLRGSLFRAGQLRSALGARDRRLVVIASTIGPDSALGRLPDLPELLAAALPMDEYRVIVVLHPGVWAAHGPWQVRGWLSQAAAHGVGILAPQEGWQAALLAASAVISDHGSLALYAAALDKPLLLVGRGSEVTVPGSAADLLARVAPVWVAGLPPHEQIEAAIEHHDHDVYERVLNLLTDQEAEGEHCAGRMRRLLYELLRLDEPAAPAAFGPVLAPAVAEPAVPASVVGATIQTDGVKIVRYPDLGHGEPHRELAYRHLTADLRTATLAQLSAASVVVTGDGAAWPTRTWRARAAAELARWPQATAVASPVDGRSCAVWTDNRATLLRADELLDPVVLASLAYLRLTTLGRIPATDRLHLGYRDIRVSAARG